MRIDDVLRKPLVLTEKGTAQREAHNKYFFETHLNATKSDIARAVATLFDAEVESVNTMIVRGKDRRMGRTRGRLQNWKKAIVTLAEGETIDVFGGE